MYEHNPWSTEYRGFGSQGCTTHCNAAHWAGGSTGAFIGQWLRGNMSAIWKGQRVLLFAPTSKFPNVFTPSWHGTWKHPRDMNFFKEFRNWNAGLCYPDFGTWHDVLRPQWSLKTAHPLHAPFGPNCNTFVFNGKPCCVFMWTLHMQHDGLVCSLLDWIRVNPSEPWTIKYTCVALPHTQASKQSRPFAPRFHSTWPCGMMERVEETNGGR